MAKPFVYQCTLDRVVDGDTIDVNIDLGFKIILAYITIANQIFWKAQSKTINYFKPVFILKTNLTICDRHKC